MNRSTWRYPSPSLVISIIALVVALGGAGYSATGGNFILGASNTATTKSSLAANINGRTLQLSNSNSGAAATPLALVAATSRPPFTVNSATKVSLLNADQLDGLNFTDFARKRTVPFTLGGGAISSPIPVPASRLVYLMGAVTGPNTPGVGQVTMYRFPGAGIMWIGLRHVGGDAGITTGIASGTGTRIMGLDTALELFVEISGPDAIRINNTGPNARTGMLTLIW